MPVSPTYPGVYVQELPSGNRTIVGVATSIVAFVGRALRGPVNTATRVSSFADFERKFGPLWTKSTLSYAVQQYFLAGGRDALVVRVVHTAEEGEEEAAQAALTVTLEEGALSLRATTTGTPGNDLSAVLTADTDDDHFTLVLKNDGATLGTFAVTMNPEDPSARIYVEDLPDAVEALGTEEDPALMRVTALPHVRPTAGTYDLTGGGSSAYAAVDITGTVSGAATSFELKAANEGLWGNRLRVSLDLDVAEEWDRETFNLTVSELDADGNVARSETHRNVTLNPDGARYLLTVLEDASRLVELVTPTTTAVPTGAYTALRPAATESATALTGGTDGEALVDSDLVPASSAGKTGIYALEDADLFNLLCLPPAEPDAALDTATWATAIAYCETRRAVCLVDAPDWVDADAAETAFPALGLTSDYAAMFYPKLRIADPLRQNRLASFPPSGVVAGIIAKTDAQRGVWKAPAGLDARAPIVRGQAVNLTDSENGRLNPLGLNCVRTFPGVGSVVWGSRTLAGADRLASDWKYLPVRRTALFIEESLYRGLQWAVFEPNDEPLWAQIRLAAGGFMHQLFRQGAFQGASPKEAYMVKCDADTTTQADIDRGIVNVLIGFAPLKPAEFVILSIQQIAGQASA